MREPMGTLDVQLMLKTYSLRLQQAGKTMAPMSTLMRTSHAALPLVHCVAVWDVEVACASWVRLDESITAFVT